MTKEVRDKCFADFKKMSQKVKIGGTIDETYKKVINACGILATATYTDLPENKQARFLILQAKAETVRQSIEDSREAIARLNSSIIGILSPSVEY